MKTGRKMKPLLDPVTRDEKSLRSRALQVAIDVSSRHGVTLAQLLGRGRRRVFAHPRQEAMYICQRDLELTYCEIGKLFGRDHTTVMYSVDAHKHRIGL